MIVWARIPCARYSRNNETVWKESIGPGFTLTRKARYSQNLLWYVCRVLGLKAVESRRLKPADRDAVTGVPAII